MLTNDGKDAIDLLEEKGRRDRIEILVEKYDFNTKGGSMGSAISTLLFAKKLKKK